VTTSVPNQIGNYLKRVVRCGAVDGVKDFQGLVMHDSLVLIDTADARLTAEEQTDLVEQIVQSRPLGVFFTGPAGALMFDRLLHALETPAHPLPMMTNFSSDALPQAVEEFLYATLPAEECWGRWQGYLLISVGGSVHELEEAAISVIASTAQP